MDWTGISSHSFELRCDGEHACHNAVIQDLGQGVVSLECVGDQEPMREIDYTGSGNITIFANGKRCFQGVSKITAESGAILDIVCSGTERVLFVWYVGACTTSGACCGQVGTRVWAEL